MEDYYKILRLTRSATKEDIKRAFRIEAKKYHPDINPNQDAGKLFLAIHKAYATLVDDNKRSLYDQKLKPEKPTKAKRQTEKYEPPKDAPAPKTDLWGNPLTPEQRRQWVINNRSDDALYGDRKRWDDDEYYDEGVPHIR